MKKRIVYLAICMMVFTVLLTGCGKGSAYKKALSMFEEGHYQEARDAFAKLEDYEDSAAYVTECDYNMASALLEAGEYEASMKIFQTIITYNDVAAKLQEAENGLMHEKYAYVFQALNGQCWYYNGGGDTILNRISFDGDNAVIDQVYYDGNGKHEGESVSCTFVVDDQNVTVTLQNGSSMQMAYSLDGGVLAWNDKGYYTLDAIEEGIQGYWNCRKSRTILGAKTVTEDNIFFDHGKVVSESASLAYGGSNGEYYYYGPYEGTYTLNFGGLDTQMRHGSEWFFNIIDGKVAVINYDCVCKPSDHLPGEHGYKF